METFHSEDSSDSLEHAVSKSFKCAVRRVFLGDTLGSSSQKNFEGKNLPIYTEVSPSASEK